MSSLKEQMYKIHENTDFVENNAGVTKVGEFKYTYGANVRPGLKYHIHYTRDKQEVFMTGGVHTSKSKIIKKVRTEKDIREVNVYGKTTFEKYSEVKQLGRELYPIKIGVIPSESDYRVGSIERYFAQKANDMEGDIFEVSKDDFDVKNPLFRFIAFSWVISGTRDEAIRQNQLTIDSLITVRGNKRLEKKLRPLQLWKPSEDSVDEVENKLDLLKTF